MIVRFLGTKSLKTAKVAALFILLLYHTRGHAQTANGDAFSRANLAFLVHNNPALGMDNVGGSTLIFDVGNVMSSKFSVGLRTLATGAENEKNRFYRLGSGVLFIYHLYPTILLHISPGIFHETATMGAKMGVADKKEYGYSGTEIIAGWEKQIVAVNDAMKLNWGTFVVYHWGNRDGSAPPTEADSPPAAPAETKGWARGIEFSFEFSL